MSSFVGYNSKYFFQIQPPVLFWRAEAASHGHVDKHFLRRCGIGCVWMRSDAIITPYVGVSYTINDYM
ncbi:MAG: hypothetical protein ACJZ72_09375 [Opitutales bacterium]